MTFINEHFHEPFGPSCTKRRKRGDLKEGRINEKDSDICQFIEPVIWLSSGYCWGLDTKKLGNFRVNIHAQSFLILIMFAYKSFLPPQTNIVLAYISQE